MERPQSPRTAMSPQQYSVADVALVGDPTLSSGPGTVGKIALVPMILAMLVLLVHLLDRQIFAIVAQPLKADFGLSDSQFGILSGIGFAVLYTLLGFPAAKWADRGDRVLLLAGATITWSVMTALTGLATGFWTLLAARAAVAVGEAGGIAPLHSLVADLHDVSCRARAFAILQLGGPIGMFVAFCGGGLIASSFDWRTVFFIAGGIGVAVGLLVLWGLPEPRRNAPTRAVARAKTSSGLRPLLAQAGFRWLLGGTALAGTGFYATLTWAPSFLARSFRLDVGSIGLVLGVGFGLFGIISVLAAGIVCDRLRLTRPNAYCIVAACAVGAAATFAAIGLLLPSTTSSLAVFVVTVMGLSAWQVPMITAVQEYAGPGNRASAAALFMLAINLGGMGIGPTLVGVLSDMLSPGYAIESLRYALLIVPLTLAAAGACWMRAGSLRPVLTS